MSGQFDRIVLPGQSGKIPVKVSTGHATGAIAKSVTVVTNIAGANASIALQVKGELWQVIQATPNSALFGNISASQTKDGPVNRKITIVNNGDAPATLTDTKSSNPSFNAELKTLEPGKKWELTVTLATQLPAGVQSGMVDISTGMADLPKLQIACSAYLVAEVDVVPNKMMIPASRSVGMQRDFYIRNNGAKPIKVTEVTATNPLIKVGLQETQTGMAFRITMDVPPEYTVPKDGDKITFKTDHPSYPMITIPITGTVTPQAQPIGKTSVPGSQIVGPPVKGNPPVAPGKLNPAAKPGAQPESKKPTGH